MNRFNVLLHREMKRRDQQLLDWRRGVLAGIDRRLFPELPSIASAEEIRTPGTVRDGYEAALNAPLAVSLPRPDHEEYPDADQWTTAARISAALVVVALFLLWLRSTAPAGDFL